MKHNLVSSELRRIAESSIRARDLASLESPEWSGINSGWEQYVNEDIRNLWEHLSEEAKLVAYFHAQDQLKMGRDLRG